jgi:hypothetical protein
MDPVDAPDQIKRMFKPMANIVGQIERHHRRDDRRDLHRAVRGGRGMTRAVPVKVEGGARPLRRLAPRRRRHAAFMGREKHPRVVRWVDDAQRTVCLIATTTQKHFPGSQAIPSKLRTEYLSPWIIVRSLDHLPPKSHRYIPQENLAAPLAALVELVDPLCRG